MKRDMELVRELLFAVETDKDWGDCIGRHPLDVVLGHLEIMMDAKLLVGRMYRDENGDLKSAYIQRLTWAGHEFLDNARNDTVWNKVTATIKNAATTASFEVLVEMLKAGVLAAIQK